MLSLRLYNQFGQFYQDLFPKASFIQWKREFRKCYHSVIAIRNSLAQSDPIKGRLRYFHNK
jgi:hypothetical protein